MKKLIIHSRLCFLSKMQRLLLMCKLVFILIFAFFMQASATGYSQDTRVNLDYKNISFKKALVILQKREILNCCTAVIYCLIMK